MKLLRVKASNFKNFQNDTTIDFVSKSKKTLEDKEYELQKIDEDLYVYNTAAFVGKNASGKTTALELLDCCYSILGDFRLENKHYEYDGIDLDIIFYFEGFIYRYTTTLQSGTSLGNKAIFTNQHIYSKPYYKTKIKEIYDSQDFCELSDFGQLPEDTSNVFFVLKKKTTASMYFDSAGIGDETYSFLFKALKTYNIDQNILANIICIFDENIMNLHKLDDHNYKIIYRDSEKVMSDTQLFYVLSSGTTKGVLLYTMVVASLYHGFDLLVDEVENHFHKTLVENMLSLYKDKTVNKKNASLIFTTHYCELLDVFNRQDNIWVCKAEDKVAVYNMYECFNKRSELLKSRQFYNNAFQTSVNYEKLMDLKRKLMK